MGEDNVELLRHFTVDHEAGSCEIAIDFEDRSVDIYTENWDGAATEPMEDCITFEEFAALVKTIRAIPEDVLEKLGVR